MYYSAIVLHEDIQPQNDFQMLTNVQAFPFRSNTCANPRKYLQNQFQIRQHKSKENTTTSHFCSRPLKNLRDQLIQKTNLMLFNRKQKTMVRVVEQPSKTGVNKSNKIQRSNEKTFSTGKMTHNYFFGHEHQFKTHSKIKSTLPNTPFGNDQFSMSVHKLNPQVNTKSKIDNRQQYKKKTVEKIVQKIRIRNQSQILSAQSNNRTCQKQQKMQQCFSPLPEKRKANIDISIEIPKVMNIRNRRIIDRNKKSNPSIDYARHDLRHARSQKPQSQQLKRPNTSATFYRKNSGGWNGQDNLAPW